MFIDFSNLLKNFSGLTFDLLPLKFTIHNWTARHADRGLAANVERQLELQAIKTLNCCPLVIKFLWSYKVSYAAL